MFDVRCAWAELTAASTISAPGITSLNRIVALRIECDSQRGTRHADNAQIVNLFAYNELHDLTRPHRNPHCHPARTVCRPLSEICYDSGPDCAMAWNVELRVLRSVAAR